MCLHLIYDAAVLQESPSWSSVCHDDDDAHLISISYLSLSLSHILDMATLLEQQTDLLQADPSATYDKIIEIDLSSIRPRINGPFTPDRSYTIDEFGDVVKKEGWPSQVGGYAYVHAHTHART